MHCELICVTGDKFTIGDTALRNTMTGDFQQSWVDINGHNTVRDFSDLQRKPAIPRTQIDNVHTWFQPNETQNS